MLAVAAAPALAANPPAVKLGITMPSDTALTWATLGGTINPEGQATTYHFEYGQTDAYGDNAPAVDVSAGSGTADVPVTRAISELELNTTYHYRLVATNGSGTTPGPDLTFQTGPMLGYGLHYEMLVPNDTNGANSRPMSISEDGTRINIEPGKQAFGDAESQHGIADRYLSTRTSSGWETTAMNPPQNPGLDVALGRTIDTTRDLKTQLTVTATREQFQTGAATIRLLQPGNLDFMAYPEYREQGGGGGSENVVFAWGGFSDDLTHAYAAVTESTRLLPTDPPKAAHSGTSYNLFEIVADPPEIRRVTLDNAGNEIAPDCGAASPGGYAPSGSFTGRSANSISGDGSKLFFSSRPGPSAVTCQGNVPAHLFVRINGTSTVELSGSECQPACASPLSEVAYGGASNDGSKVVFSTVQQLVNADTDTTRDLYLYDFDKPAGQHLTLVSEGDVTPGSGAQVVNLMRMSQDGTHIYFVAAGVLSNAPNSFGQVAQAGANNLYLYEPLTGQTAFVARLDAADSSLWSDSFSSRNQFTDDSGRILLLSVDAKISPADTDTATDLYRYDAQSRELLQITPPGNAAAVQAINSGGESVTGPEPRAISADGSTIAFETTAGLRANDINGVNDTYLWHDGSISLVTDGQAPRGGAGSLVSQDGSEIAFATAAKLVPKDANSVVSAYVAHTGPDIEPPIVAPPPPCASSQTCRGSTPAAPVDGVPGTPGFLGEGNLETPKPAAAKKQHKKAHKKKQHKKKAHKKTHRAQRHTTRRGH
jgi:hypothetical protein